MFTKTDLYMVQVLEKLKLKFWGSFNEKNIYLLRKMDKILNVKTLNLRKQIFWPECESTSFVKVNLRKMLRKSNFILLCIIFI